MDGEIKLWTLTTELHVTGVNQCNSTDQQQNAIRIYLNYLWMSSIKVQLVAHKTHDQQIVSLTPG